MIGKLKGLIDSYGEDYVILDVGGVGYQVHCSSRTLQALPSPGEAAVLSIESYVREDQTKLFAFCIPCRASAPRPRSRCCRLCRPLNLPMPSPWATRPRCRAPPASARNS